MNSKITTRPLEKVRISEIAAGLDGLWSQFNDTISSGRTVMRACMSNLIIYCDHRDEADAIGCELSDIVDVHPAKVLLLIGQGQPAQGSAEAFVSLYHTAVAGGLQVCAERIDVVTSADAAGRLPSVARAHLIGDLPTALWWASRRPPPEAGAVFFELAELADQIIYDNMGWTNPTKAVATMTRWVASQQDEVVVYNLAWRRTAVWRKLIGQVMDPRVAPDALTSLHLIEIEHGPHALAMTWLLVGWLGSCLGWQAEQGKSLSNSELVWKFRTNGRAVKVVAHRLPEGEPLLYRLSFDWSKDGQERKTCFERLDHESIGITETRPTASPRSYSAQLPKRSDLVAAQLAHRERDKILENALKVSNAMAELF
ncbi:MAG: glucose-6-phosphate dehydrogenase assembly protein OpcA [Gammaproteobacteria bacterium]